MKYFSYLLLALLIISCGTEEDSLDCKEEKYEEEFSARLGDIICFPDGKSVEIKTITDQFCCCQCICFWEGELQVMVETTLEDGTKALYDFGSATYDGDFVEEIFPGYSVQNFNFLYDDQTPSFPLCNELFYPEKIELFIKIASS